MNELNDVEYFLNDEPVKKFEPQIQIDNDIKNRLWKLDEIEYENLKQSIINEGCREPIILWNNTIIDGHNRYEICKNFDIEFKTVQKHFNSKNEALKWIDSNQLTRRNLKDWQRDLVLGRLSKQHKQVGFKGNQYTKSGEGQNGLNQIKLAKDLNIGINTLKRNEKYLDAYEDIERNVGKAKADELVSKLTKQDIITIGKEEPFKQEETINKILDSSAKSYNVVKRQKIVEELEKKQLETSEKHYRIVYADPPWKYGNSMPDNVTVPADYYPAMSTKEICEMPVKDITWDDAVLFLWSTSPHLEEAFEVIKAWGFKYKTSFVWDKVKHNMGHYNSVRHELLLVCTKGSCTPDQHKLFDSVVTIERTEHSKKPEFFRQIIDTIYTKGNRLELFARTKNNDNWDVFGNEV